ncbi:hypothetical protein ACFPK5_08960 [Streptomyces beijiangensis]|uniref:hypothetical protein n=1 Tax=Streptomyces beijiangensis TaxID=163361 RepID=UPI0031E24AFC
MHDAVLQLYRILVAVAVLWKSGATLLLGDWNRIRIGSFGRYQLEKRHGAARVWMISTFHKPLILARLAAAVLLLLGVGSRVAILVIVLGFVHELCYEYRFNTIYITLCLCCLLPAQRLGTGFELSGGTSTANSWSQFLVVLLTVDVYWNSAYQKLRSPQFMTGLSLVQQSYVAAAVRPQMTSWEYWHPATGATRAMAGGAVRTRWRAVATTVVVLEILLPVGLLTPALRSGAIVVGMGLHLAFMAILPLRLAPFTLVTLASYPLFMP